jgi:hypothetical protein
MRAACFDYYHFGSVTLTFNDHDRTYRAGDTVRIEGEIENHNNYPVPDGTVIVRIQREDDTVADRDWHPIVAEMMLPKTYSLPSNGNTPFLFEWKIPERALGGSYLVEFSYLAGGRYVLGGIPYIANFPAASAHFNVEENDTPLAVTFDRSSVLLNKKPLSLRAMPPSFQPGESIMIDARLNAESSKPVPTRIRAALYEWSDSRFEAPLIDEVTDVTIVPGKPFRVPITWSNAKPGAYELVLAAVPLEPNGLPSVLKVRFPVVGDVPLVIYSGIGMLDEATGQVTITTCTVNGTMGGTREGRVDVVVSTDGKEIASGNGPTSSLLSAVNLNVPLAKIGKVLEVAATARDPEGTVTDGHVMRYPRGTLRMGLRPAAPPASPINDPIKMEEPAMELPEHELMPSAPAPPLPTPSTPLILRWLVPGFGNPLQMYAPWLLLPAPRNP